MKTADDPSCMKKIKKVFMISYDAKVDEELIQKILKKNYSRIPVYFGHENKRLVIGILLTKSLIGVNLNESLTVAQLISQKKCKIKEPLYVKPDTSLETILKLFQQGFVHQAIVVDNPEAISKDAETVAQYLCEENEDESKNQLDALQKQTKKHNVMGIVTMEKVLETYLNTKFLDEKDRSKAENYRLNDTSQSS